MLADLDLSAIQDECARALIVRLLNLIEDQAADLRTAQEELQRLRDENNRLKGEQGKPAIKPNKEAPPTDHSSECERRQPTERVKHGKRATITINREDVARVDPANLPPDAEFKGLAAAAIIILLAMILILNAGAIWLRNRYEKKW